MIYDSDILAAENIEYSAPIPFSVCKIINSRRLSALVRVLTPLSAVVFLVPYYDGEEKGRNISRYAVARDYHLYMNTLFDSVIPRLEGKYNSRFFGMADSSPCDERAAAAYAGLGVPGDNGLLINEKYGSYVFIGALYTDAVFDCKPDMTKGCNHCGACKSACPAKDGLECLSSLTQKKGALTQAEEEYIKKYGSAWGCDICSEACPLNKNTAKTPISFFKENKTPRLDAELIINMTDEELKIRAYGWRGREVPLRNCKILDN